MKKPEIKLGKHKKWVDRFQMMLDTHWKIENQRIDKIIYNMITWEIPVRNGIEKNIVSFLLEEYSPQVILRIELNDGDLFISLSFPI